MKYFILMTLLITLTILGNSVNPKSKKHNYPLEIITNGILKVTVMLPDADNGYYRSTRFDWSGIIAQVEYDNHTYFQNWEYYNGTLTGGPHDPLNAGTGTGTVEEFRDAPGYDEAKVGEPFLKIGVGILERAENKPHHWNFPYKFVKKGEWKVVTKKNSIRFVQKIETDFDYGYRYEKTIVLKENKPEVEIIHTLKNTGEKEIHANPYCHNFFQFDGQEVGAKAKLTRQVRIKRFSGSQKIIIEKVLYDFMSSHMARRTCVTHLLEDGVPPTTVMKLTDHQDLKTILKYENTSLKALKSALTKSVA